MAATFRCSVWCGATHLLGGWLDLPDEGQEWRHDKTSPKHTDGLVQAEKLVSVSFFSPCLSEFAVSRDSQYRTLRISKNSWLGPNCTKSDCQTSLTWRLSVCLTCWCLLWQVESKLWMMTGEDASFGNRKIRYDDEDYCVEAYGISSLSFDSGLTFLLHYLLLVQHCATLSQVIFTVPGMYLHACNKCTFTLPQGIRAFSPSQGTICTLLDRSRQIQTDPDRSRSRSRSTTVTGTVNPTICKPPLDWTYRSFGMLFAQKRWRDGKAHNILKNIKKMLCKMNFTHWDTLFQKGTSLQFHLSSAFF